MALACGLNVLDFFDVFILFKDLVFKFIFIDPQLTVFNLLLGELFLFIILHNFFLFLFLLSGLFSLFLLVFLHLASHPFLF
jgi:hypothetical protein